MSKRGADEYITKENGATPNKQEESNVKMATAAQLAKRKMAAPKSRLNRAPAGASMPNANPFGASSFAAPQAPSQPSFGSIGGGVTFGQSQSFPPSTSAPSGGFAFGAPTQSTSFTFGQPVQNNPFASLSSNPTTTEAAKPAEDTIMESPQKKPAFGSGAFTAGQGTGTNGSVFGGFTGFGQSASTLQSTQPSQPSASIFGQSQVNGFASSPSEPLFGQSQSQASSDTKPAEPTAEPISLFAQSVNTQKSTSENKPVNSGFGQSLPPQATTPTFSFGQPASDTTKNSFSFGQAAANPPSHEQTKNSLSSAGSQTSQSESKPSTPAFSFGQTKLQPSNDNNIQPENTTLSSNNSIFGSPAPKPAATSNLFGGLASTQPAASFATSTTEQEQKRNDSSAVKTSIGGFGSSMPAATANPFAGLFGQTSQTSAAQSDEAAKPVFNFAAPAQPSGLFGESASPVKSTPGPQSSDSAVKPSFEFKPVETPKASLFSITKPDTEKKDTSATSIFATPAKTTPGAMPSFSFGQPSASKTPAASEVKTSSSIKFGESGASKSTPTSNASAAFETPKASSQQKPRESVFAKDTSSAEQATPAYGKSMQATPAPTSINPTASEPQEAKRTVYSNPPARIPPYLNAEKYKSYDSNYRLHSLNREFQKRIATLDPTREDFENIVRTYVAARESIGESIGLYTRNIAGMKRKEDQLDEREGEPNTAKKVKQVQGSDAKQTPNPNQFSSSIFQPVPSTTKTANINSSSSFAGTPSKATVPTGSTTSSLFKSMIPDNSAPSSNPFANLSTPVTNNDGSSSTTKPSIAFGGVNSKAPSGPNFAASNSTTPPSSPPKKSGFTMPSFGAASGGDFMSAFKKQAAASTAKFEKEAMEKRKAEDFDSDEDDEAEWTKKYEEEQEAKKAKISAFKGFTPSFGATKSAGGVDALSKASVQSSKDTIDISSDDETSNGQNDADHDDAEGGKHDNDDSSDPEADDPEADDHDAGAHLTSGLNGKSLFDRVSRASPTKTNDTPKSTPASAVQSKSSFFGGVKATPEAPSFSPITPSTSTPFKPTTTFSFTPTPRESPTPTAGASVFDGGIVKDGPIPGEGLFGSRSSTPVNGEQSRPNIFGSLGTSQTTSSDDHTWKRGSGIKFGSDLQAPSVNITAPSPVKETPKFDTLFGLNASTNGQNSSAPLGFNFGSTASGPAPGFLGAASHLAPTSGTTSGISSRATSPGATDNESVATNETEDAQVDPQTSLLAHSGPYPGEEDEDILFEARAKIHRNYKEAEIQGTKKQRGWNVEGVGPMRVLTNKTTGKTRIVARAEPNANVVLNANLTPGVPYKATGSNIVVPVFGTGAPVQWMIKVKTAAIASELAGILEKHKDA